MTITQKQLAQKLGVSQMTVSLAFKGDIGRVSEETRKRILDTAKELGYRPHSAAKAMRDGRFGAIGFVMSQYHHKSRLEPELLRGINRVLEPAGHSLSIAYIDDDRLTDAGEVPKMLTELMVDGLILNYNHSAPDGMAELLERLSVPCVWVNNKLRHNSVYADDAGGARAATAALLAEGYERIAYCDFSGAWAGTDEVQHYSRPARLHGYEQAIADAGAKPYVIFPQKAPSPPKAIDQVIRLLRGRRKPPTAVLCYGRLEYEGVVGCQLCL